MYPNYPYFAVAITRTCGSGGGSYIGKQLAKAFDIDLYDRKLLRLASEDSGISEELFAHADENTRKTMLYRVSERVYDGSIIPPESGNFISDENLFNYQAKVLRELLNEESYICVGRAADFVLRDKPNVLTVYATGSTPRRSTGRTSSSGPTARSRTSRACTRRRVSRPGSPRAARGRRSPWTTRRSNSSKSPPGRGRGWWCIRPIRRRMWTRTRSWRRS